MLQTIPENLCLTISYTLATTMAEFKGRNQPLNWTAFNVRISINIK